MYSYQEKKIRHHGKSTLKAFKVISWYIMITVNLLTVFSNFFPHSSSIIAHLTFCCLVTLDSWSGTELLTTTTFISFVSVAI